MIIYNTTPLIKSSREATIAIEMTGSDADHGVYASLCILNASPIEHFITSS